MQSKQTEVEDVEVVAEDKKPTPEQLAQYLELMQKRHNALCRKKGFTKHFHQPAGSKLSRKLLNDGYVYGRRSIVQQSFDNIQKRKFELSKSV